MNISKGVEGGYSYQKECTRYIVMSSTPCFTYRDKKGLQKGGVQGGRRGHGHPWAPLPLLRP